MTYPKAEQLIKSWEKCRLEAYKDSGGIWTCGWGSTGPDINEHTVWTQEEADKRFNDHFQHMVTQVRSLLLYPDLLSENQMSAILSLSYNIGTEAFKASTLRTQLNLCSPLIDNGQIMKRISEQFLRWEFDNHKQVPGLLARRKAEQAIFLEAS